MKEAAPAGSASKLRHRTLVLAIALSAALTMLALQGPIADAQTRTSQLDRALAEIVDAEGGPPGVAVMIKRPGKTEFLSRGVSNLASERGFTPGLHSRIASMAKAFNGAVLLSLVDEGALELDDTIGEWLPGVWPKADQVTIAQLLDHTSGLPEYIDKPAFIELLMTDPSAYRTPIELMSYVNTLDPEFDPGSEYHYSDSDNIMAALIAEAASGDSYQRLLRRLVFKPLGLKRTSLPETMPMPRPYVHGYAVIPGGFEDESEVINPALAWASGGMVSTARDIGRFFRGYVGGKLLDGKGRRGHRNFVPGKSSPPGPGRNEATAGLFRYTTRCGKVFGHTGSFPGYRQFAASSKDGKRSVVFTVNSQIVPNMGPPKVNSMIRQAQAKAVCRALR